MFTLSTLALFSTLALAVPVPRAKLDAATLLKNGRTAQNLNAQYQNTSASDACTSGESACVNNALASCVDSKWQLKQCVDSLSCFTVPSLTASGVNVTCTSERNTLSAIKSTGASNVVALANEDDESCDPDTGDDDDNDNDNGDDDTCDSDNGDDSASDSNDGDDDTCDPDSDNGDSGAGTTTVTVTASTKPTQGTEKTVTVTVTPNADATTISITAASAPAPSITGTTTLAFTTVVTPDEASSIISSLEQEGATATTIGGAGALAQPSASRPIIQLTQPDASAPAPTAGNNAGAAAGNAPVLTLLSAAAAPPAASATFAFGDY